MRVPAPPPIKKIELFNCGEILMVSTGFKFHKNHTINEEFDFFEEDGG